MCSSGVVVTKEEYPTAWLASCCVSRLHFSAVGSVSVIYCSRNHYNNTRNAAANVEERTHHSQTVMTI